MVNTWVWDRHRPLLSQLQPRRPGKGSRASGLADGSVGFEKAVALNEPQAAPEASAQPKLHMWQARKDIKWIIVNSEPGHLLSCAYFMKQNQ